MTSTETRSSWSNRLSPRNWSLAWKLVAVGLVPALLAVVLGRAADTVHLTRVSTDDWVQHASLNALSTAIILHVACPTPPDAG